MKEIKKHEWHDIDWDKLKIGGQFIEEQNNVFQQYLSRAIQQGADAKQRFIVGQFIDYIEARNGVPKKSKEMKEEMIDDAISFLKEVSIFFEKNIDKFITFNTKI